MKDYTGYRKNCTVYVALRIVTRKMADKMDISGNELVPDTNIRTLCDELDVSRSRAYQVEGMIEKHLDELCRLRPGRPANGKIESYCDSNDGQRPRDAARIEALEYRLQFPGSVVQHRRRQDYSPGFRRFILGRYDHYVPTRLSTEEFAASTEVPVDTLRNWLQLDRNELSEEKRVGQTQHPDTIIIPEDASGMVYLIVELYQNWHGSTRDFIPYCAKALGLKPCDVTRILRILKIIRPGTVKPPKYPGSTEKLSPGSMSVIDGKEIAIYLVGSDTWTKKTVHVAADQATNTITGIAASQNECAEKALEVFRETVEFQGGKAPMKLLHDCETCCGDEEFREGQDGKAPEGLLHDRKPCYKDEEFREEVEKTTMLVQATKGRGENKAVIEGAFSEFERQFGAIRLDDSSRQKLLESAVQETFRAFAASRNHAPRIEHEGQSRIDVLRKSCPSREQQKADRNFICRLKARHESEYPTFQDLRSRALLDEGFQRWSLTEKDPGGHLRKHLSWCEPSAVRRGFMLFSSRMQRGVIKERYAHRYLAKLIQSCQEEIDFERAEDELLRSCETEYEWWLAHEEKAYQEIVENGKDSLDVCCQIAEMAAHGSLPINGAFWRDKLRKEVERNRHHAAGVRRFLRRLYEAPQHVRLGLITSVAEVEYGLAA